uniref:LAGLIDADG endonuclease n=1 Tax=Ramaria rubella TaxID=113071 RepID=UPI0022377087
KNIGFLMWLCAGITSLPVWVSFKYSHLIDKLIKVIVTMLIQRSQSAGNFLTFSNVNESTSETLRDKSVIKKISVHVPTHLKPSNDADFGHYLAGLIDGDGHFSKTPQIVVVFNELDASLAYFIKGKIGYGNVYKVKIKKAVILVVSNQAGIKKVLELINGKLRSQNKLDQIKNNILLNSYFKTFTHFNVNTNVSLNNYWLSGFSDADASFQIKLITRRARGSASQNKIEVRLNFQIDQKKNDLLILIKQFLGGNIGYRKSQHTYYYGSTSFGSAKKVINYFDKFHLLSSKHVNYLKWRKTYILIQNKEHLTMSGLTKITKLKNTMNRNLPLASDVNNG